MNLSSILFFNKLFTFFILSLKTFLKSGIKLNFSLNSLFILLKLSLKYLLINTLKSSFGINSVDCLKLFFKLSKREVVSSEKH